MRMPRRSSATSSPTTRSAARCSRRRMCRRRGSQLLRSAFQTMVSDPDFQAEAAQLKLPLAPQDRRGDAEGRRRPVRHFARRAGQGPGREQAVTRTRKPDQARFRQRAARCSPCWCRRPRRSDDFYRGKTITIIIPIGPGGAYDAYARLLSRHLGRHLPGNPTIIARNMPGGGGVIASNHLYNVAPQDGTTLAIIISSFANDQLFDNPQIKYDAREFLAVGRLLDTTSVLFFWHASPIKTLRDLSTSRASVGITAVNDVPAYRLRAMNRLLGTKIKLISGLSVGARLRARLRARRNRRRSQHLYRACRSCSRRISPRRSSTSWCSSRLRARPR